MDQNVIKILCAHGVPEEMKKRLAEIGQVFSLNSHDEVEIKEAIRDKHVFVVRSKPRVTRDIIESASQLKVVARPGVGIDNIDQEACREKGIRIINTPEASTSSVAELTIGLAIALLRRIYYGCNLLKRGEWVKGKCTGRTIEGKTWGVIGFGGIGRRVAELVKAFGAEVYAYDPYVEEGVFVEKGVRRALSLNELLAKSDIVSLHVVLNQETENMISEEAISKMKRGAYLINTSRGKVVDQKALYQALLSGQLGGVALDVYDTEPPTDQELLGLENVICTPHIGGNTEEVFVRATDILIVKLKEVLGLSGGQPLGY
ncbi:MAG: D-3-phosphoglycerate dehydrogenase / 2-oxoglutarate reductase [Candidatus Atribacteria bacterium]|uniref:Hydroxyacid dehydrogenase n=1 Tax=Thermatribacter velox TaxID=3039681 RepID=A0ABZ2YFQ0_9BACT|nr:D-3-phosphoglycerate dehydrogenase / 2-oxoglutarate reductase [Candidatus Atribacteria bacterium]MDI3530858.1 D-3-phosphoglycerate dehydrogenase / 2-oxoglutarate reductase [Candidatus Atribacteria bacterium]